MTMARETEIKAESVQVVVLSKKVECSGQLQSQLIAIQRLTFYLFKDLR
jgi:hypothetical protein